MQQQTAGLTFILNVHPIPESDNVFPFVHKEFHLMEHELPVWPIDVNSKTFQKLKTSNSNSIRYIKSALIHIATTNRPERVADDSPQIFTTDVSIHAPIPSLPIRLHGAIPKHTRGLSGEYPSISNISRTGRVALM
jgi:hypothetical protein